LPSYEAERRPVARQTLDAATAQEAFTAPAFADPALGDDTAEGRALREQIARALHAAKDPEFHSLGLVLGYDHRSSPVVWPEAPLPAPCPVTRFVPSAHAGARLPHAWLGEDLSLYDELGREFSILTWGASCDPFARAAAQAGIGLTVVDLGARPDLRDRYGADLVLVRPDQHVAWRGDDASRAGEILARAVGR
jgi:hypothetical protein